MRSHERLSQELLKGQSLLGTPEPPQARMGSQTQAKPPPDNESDRECGVSIREDEDDRFLDLLDL